MYTIGQVANIMGISKDKLRYYEEKGVLKPSQNNENNYRQYSLEEMLSILSIEFYRSLDLDFKSIKRIHNQSDIKDLEEILEDKRKEIVKEVDRLNAIVNRINKAKKACNDIERYLNKFSIRAMKPIKVLGEMSDFTAFNEFEVIHENKD
ncbi:MerR family transcriptional regulator [Clostridium paridis]|uniref:MerR family transcriptional regulator n=1 Tax=Clostridium paridis TaxID=2803863 RepID=A0A937K5K0_9CLOT|nr:MerR family transcriptional regulator [Clostridium paridis]MBL4933119.1 MerR family transcriptional regulator [Clostridium paridis]